MIKEFAKEFPARVKAYTRENLGAPFIVGFMLLLMVAAVSLSMGLAVLTNEVAVYAYYALVIGVVLQFTRFLTYNQRGFVKEILVRVKAYTRENLGAPFIVGFMLLLMVAVVSLSMGLAVLTNEVAVYAYYALVIGVVLQFTRFLKYNKKNGETNHESS